MFQQFKCEIMAHFMLRCITNNFNIFAYLLHSIIYNNKKKSYFYKNVSDPDFTRMKMMRKFFFVIVRCGNNLCRNSIEDMNFKKSKLPKDFLSKTSRIFEILNT